MERKSNHPASIKNLIQLLFWIVILCNSIESTAQHKHDYHWAFGYGPGYEPNDTFFFGGFLMQFTDGIVSFRNQKRLFDFDIQSNGFSSGDGSRLQLLSNGCLIAGEDGLPIKGGDSISFGRNRSNCPRASLSSQAGFFINFATNPNLIKFVHTQWDSLGIRHHNKRILLSTVDLTVPHVVSINEELIFDTMVWNSFIGIPDHEYKNWWIIKPKAFSNKYITIKIDELGQILNLDYQSIGFNLDSSLTGNAQSTFSPNGEHYAIYFPLKGLQLFDFDRVTGLLSNARHYPIVYLESPVYGGVAFSPDSKKLYFNTHRYFYQLDLEEVDPEKAIDTIGEYDNFFDPFPTTFNLMQLGPDCRIYMSTYYNNRYLHVILYPDRKGKDCGFLQRGVRLPARNGDALPNNPHYRVNEPWPCDSTIRLDLHVGLNEGIIDPNPNLFFYPQPAADFILLQPIQDIIGPASLFIYDLQGILLLEKK